MHWPKEDSVSVLSMIKLIEGSVVGDTCSVRLGKQVHCGSILGIGKFLYLWNALLMSIAVE